MKEEIKLGLLAPDYAGRDAIHIAIAPVVVLHDMEPGDRAKLSTTLLVHGDPTKVFGCMKDDPESIGIIDPFLRYTVKTGQRCYLLLDQGTITGLRHVWTHPAFTNRVLERKV